MGTELELDGYCSFSTFSPGFKFPLLNSQGEDAVLFLNFCCITHYTHIPIPGTLGNAKTGKAKSLLSGRLTTEGKKRVYLSSKGVNPQGEGRAVLHVPLISAEAPNRDVGVETCARFSSCPGSVSHWRRDGQLLGLLASVFPWENGNTIGTCPMWTWPTGSTWWMFTMNSCSYSQALEAGGLE